MAEATGWVPAIADAMDSIAAEDAPSSTADAAVADRGARLLCRAVRLACAVRPPCACAHADTAAPATGR